VKLADEPGFVKGPEWEGLSQENVKTAESLKATEQNPKPPQEDPQPAEREPAHEELQKRKTSRPEIDI